MDLHSSEPWVLSAMYSGSVVIWNYDTETLVKTFEVSTLPVRSAKFIDRKQWFIACSDDMKIRVYNYNTMDRVTIFEAHTDYIRHIEVHPSLPYVLTCADDMQIKLWDWDKNWSNTQTFEGHGHYVMMAKFNPKDTSTFASASMDRSIKVWGLGTSQPHFSLDGHERGVNCVDYYAGGDKPYLVSGSDDKTVKIWDYQTKSIIHTLDGHSHNLTNVIYHPRLPLIISACEDGTVRMWHNTTYKAESTLNYGMERAWSLSVRSSNKLAVGYDEGTVVLRLGHDMPVVSMEASGKIVIANNHDIATGSVKGVVSELQLKDGERVPVSYRDLGSCDLYPQRLQHNSNGRYVVVAGNGEYIIYTSQQLRNKSFGSALDFIWSPFGTGDYVTRESISRLVMFKNFKESKSVKPNVCTAEGLYTGQLIGVRGSDCVAFYDWDEFRFVRKIDVLPKNVYWSDSGDLVLFACDDSYYVLQYNRDAVNEALANGTNTEQEGVEGAFELVHEMSEKIGTGQWIGDCFLYATNNGRLNYYVGGQVMTLAHFDSKLYFLGYLAKENNAYLMDKNKHVFSYTVSLLMLEYQTAVVRNDFDTANDLLPQIPSDQMDAVARFLESQGYREEALALSTDPDFKFDLAVQLAQLDTAKEIILSMDTKDADTTDGQHKWKQLGDLALNDGQLELFEDCAIRSDDFSGLLLLYSSTANYDGLQTLANMAEKKGRNNIVFLAHLLLGDLNECLNILIATKRFPEAAFFARTYVPSKVGEMVSIWRDELMPINSRVAKSLACPELNDTYFPDLKSALEVEQKLQTIRSTVEPASTYASSISRFEGNLLQSYLETDEVGYSVSGKPRRKNTAELENKVDHLEKERAAQEEQARIEAERHAAEVYAKEQEAHEAKVKEERRLAQEKAESNAKNAEAAQQEAERLKQLEFEKIELLKKEEMLKLERQKAQQAAEAQQQEELARAQEEQRLEHERIAKEQAAEEKRLQQEQQEAAEKMARMEKERQEAQENQARMEKEKQDAARLAEEQALQAERAENERRRQEAQELAEKTAALNIASAQENSAENAPSEGLLSPSNRDSLDFDLGNEDLDFDDDDADWGDM